MNNTSPSLWAVGTSSFIRLKERNTVLFPQPEGPMMAVIFLALDGKVNIFHSPKTAIIYTQVACLDGDL